jgi:SAM-dependent methyltransferase
MSKVRKAKDYILGAVKNPKLFKYYLDKTFKYKKLGYSDELLYWKHEMSDRSPDWYQNMQYEFMLAVSYIEKAFDISGKYIMCLDIGSGPRSRLTAGFDTNKYSLIAVDPLADEFIKEFGGRLFLQKGKGEDLDKMFPPRSFHIVYSCNAIDHADSPPDIIENVKNILKKDGILIICGNIDNGDLSHWLGLHQHNLHLKDDELMWQTKSMKKQGKEISIVNKNDFKTIVTKNTLFKETDENIPWFFGMWSKN